MAKDKSSRSKTGFDLKKHSSLIALFLFLIALLVYFGPFLSGKKMLYGSDWLMGGYADEKVLMDYVKENGELPMWKPTLFGGNASISLSPAKYYYPIRFIGMFVPVHIWHVYQYILHLLLAGIGMFFLLREMKLSHFASFLGGLIYIFSGTLISTTYGGHLGRTIAGSFMPILFFFLLRALNRKKLVDFALFGLIGALAVHSSHTQLMYYIDLSLGFFFLLFLAIELAHKNFKKVLKIILFFAIGVLLIGLLSAVIVLPTVGNLGLGTRGQERGYNYATSWSMPLVESLDVFVHGFSGAIDRYWGDNYFKLHSEYLGILPLILAILGIVLSWKRKELKFFLVLAVVALLSAFGRYTIFYRIPYHLVPMISKFRGPGMFFFLANFFIVVLAGFGFDGISDLTSKLERKKTLITLGVICGVMILLLLIFGVGKQSIIKTFQAKITKTVQAEYGPEQAQTKARNFAVNYPNLQSGLTRSFIIAALVSLFLLLLAYRKLKPVYITLILIPILLYDLWSVDKKFIQEAPPPERYYAADQVINFLKKDDSLYRVFPLHYSNNSACKLNGIQILGGYGPNPLARYQQFIGAGESVMFNPKDLLTMPHLLNLLNTKYIIGQSLPDNISGYDQRTQNQILALRNYFKYFIKVYDTGKYTIYKNPYILDRVYIVPNYEVAESPETALAKVKNPTFKPLQKVILEKDPGVKHLPAIRDTLSNAEVEKFTANEILISASMKMPGFLVLSENYHPDWKAYVDGEKREIFIANYAFRAIYLEEGEHQIKVEYKSKYRSIGKAVSLIGFVLTLAIFAAAIIRQKKNKS